MASPAHIRFEDEGDQGRMAQAVTPQNQSWFGSRPVLFAAAAGTLCACVVGFAGWWAWGGAASATPSAKILETVDLTNKPALDKRNYKYAKFSNGIEVLNIQDKNTQNSGFSVAVQSGSFNDGGLDGLAHFCEHMLFLGTQKYPDQSGFDTFMNLHGGYNNAYTAEEATVYFAQLDKAGFSEGLDRFADFFRAPLFNKDGVGDEVHAIGSEHAKNQQDPTWRIFATLNSLANPKSPVQGFHTGDVDTLVTKPKEKGIDTVEELRKYFDKNYCAPRLRLVTFSPESTDDQLQKAFDKFSDLSARPECAATPQSYALPEAWGPDNLGHYVHLGGTAPQAQLWLFFAMPDATKEYASKPLDYLEHVIGYGGEHSLQYVLQEELGLALSVQPFSQMNSAGTSFYVVFELTPAGKDNLSAVIDAFFMYMQKLKDRGVDMDLYKSLAAVEELGWKWSEMSEVSDMVSEKSEAMTRLPHEDLLSGDSLITSYDADAVKELMDMIDPKFMNIAYVDPTFDSDKEHETLPFYGVEYVKSSAVDHFPILTDASVTGSLTKEADDKWAERLRGAGSIWKSKEAPKLVLPQAIKNIPSNITLKNSQAALGKDELSKIYGVRPALLKEGEKKMAWFREGSTTGTPKMSMRFELRPSRQQEPSAHEILVAKIYSSLVNDQLSFKTYDLRSTGISYSLQLGARSLNVAFGGFKDNLKDIMQMVMTEFTEEGKVLIKPENVPRFDRIVQDLKETFTDYSSMPVQQGMKDRNMLLSKGSFSNQEFLAALEKVTLEDIQDVGKNFMEQPLQVTSLAMGNIGNAESSELNEYFHTFISQVDDSVDIEDVETIHAVVKPGKRVEMRKVNPREGDSNHVTAVSIMYGVPDDEESVLFGLLSNVLGPAAYDELRTKQQLGYVVSGGIGQISNVLQASVVVQGDVKLPDDIELQIDMVMNKIMQEKLDKMTEEEFQTLKDSYESSMIEPPLGLSDEVSMFSGLVSRGGICPNRITDQLFFLRNNLRSKDQLITAWNKLLRPVEPRSRVVVKYFSANLEGGIPKPKDSAAIVDELTSLGLTKEAVAQFKKEYDGALMLDSADSSARHTILKQHDEPMMFPAELRCNNGQFSEVVTKKSDQGKGKSFGRNLKSSVGFLQVAQEIEENP